MRPFSIVLRLFKRKRRTRCSRPGRALTPGLQSKHAAVPAASSRPRQQRPRARGARAVGGGRHRSSSSATGTAAARSGRSSTARSRRTRSSALHTAWGRTLKDVFQRYKALQGFDQRYQNGFDCQGLWIEVGRREAARAELEARDRGVRARRVRAALPRGRRVVGERAVARLEAPRAVDGLGQRLLHLQRHEHRVHLAVPEDRPRARLALPRPSLDRVVPALRDVAVTA